MADFVALCKAAGLPEPVPEYRFHQKRRWRIDYAWPEHKLAVEIEGGAWVYGRHTRPQGFIRDIEKYNALTLDGWHLLRFTPKQVRTGEALRVVAEWIKHFGGIRDV